MAKKRKRKKLSSSSSEEDEKVSKKHNVTKHYRRAKRKQDVKSQESCAAKQENCAFPTIKDISQSTRQIKKPVYKLAKTQDRPTDQKPVNDEKDCTKPKYSSVPCHGGNCSSKAENYISGKDNTASGSKIVERRPSKPLNASNAGAVPQRTEETSKCSLDETTSQRSPSKLKKELMSPSLVSAKQKEQAHIVQKRKYRADEPPRNGNDSNTIKTRELCRTSSISKNSTQQKRRELVKEMCQRHQENKLEAERSLKKEYKKSLSTIKQSSTSVKQTTSVSSSNVMKNITSIPVNVLSVSHKTAKSSSAQQTICSLASPLPPNFKIPKKVQPRPVDGTCKNSDAISTNRNPKCGTELSSSEANSMQETVQQAHSCSDVTTSFSSQGQEKRSSLSGNLPATSDTVSEPCYDQLQVVEKLHLARSEKRLEVNVMQSYGTLTCMDIDPPEEGAADTHCEESRPQDLILVLDTNILLSHLDYVKKIISHGLGDLHEDTCVISTCFFPTSCSLSPGLPCGPDPLGGASGAGFLKKGKRPVRFCGPPGHTCNLLYLQHFEEPGTTPLGAVYAAGR